MKTNTTIKTSKIQRSFGYRVSDKDRMFCYMWTEKALPDEPKFGERWVLAGLDPEMDCWERIRDSVGVRKHVVDKEEIILHKIWDVSEMALRPEVNRMYQHGRMDDYIRPVIMHRIARSEFHSINWQEAVRRVDNFLATKQALSKPNVLMRKQQTVSLDTMMKKVHEVAEGGSDHANVIANLCARFGKTIWALMAFNRMSKDFGNDIMVVPVYWLSVMTSFRNEATKYQDFDDITVVNTSDDDAEEQAATAIALGKRVLALVSLHGRLDETIDEEDQAEESTNVWMKRHKWLAEASNSRMFIFADEADFGTHTKNQKSKLKYLFG